jgi:hypothetical protein
MPNGCCLRGDANLLPLEDEGEAAGPFLKVGDHRLPPFQLRPGIQPLERAQLREPVVEDRPARVEEPSPTALLHPHWLQLLGQEVDEAVGRAVPDTAPERELVLARLEGILRRVEPCMCRDTDRQVERVGR